jgi:rfaE bifunctional protein kinase chain/domain
MSAARQEQKRTAPCGVPRSRLLEILNSFPGLPVAVWGDLILDEYLYGTTRRVSREAPVLILRYAGSEFTLGGAGNALLNLKALGADTRPAAAVGRDEAGRTILDILRKERIPVSGVQVRAELKTPVKTRIMAGEENTRKQQILRIDRESRVRETAEIRAAMARELGRSARRCRALLISDYDYLTVQEDVFRRVLPLYVKAGLPVTLDSRFRLLRFPGVTAATPNEPEASAAANTEIGDDSSRLERAGRVLLGRLGSPALLITRGSRGMALFEKTRKPVLMPVHGTTHIVDVTGAGDTVISAFTLCLAAGASFREAAALANIAGGLAVMKKGTVPVGLEELRQAVSAEP